MCTIKNNRNLISIYYYVYFGLLGLSINISTIYAQPITNKPDFFKILNYLPDSCITSNTLTEIFQMYKEIDPNCDNYRQYYDFDQPYEDFQVKNDSMNIYLSISIDTENYLLIIDDGLSNRISIKAYMNDTCYLIGYAKYLNDQISYSTRIISFYTLDYNGNLKDISKDYLATLNFCENNYSKKMRTFLDEKDLNLNCNPKKFIYFFTQTDTIWIMDNFYDIIGSYSVNELIDSEYIIDVYYARKYLLKNGKFVPITESYEKSN
jgi:hypothetical protein